jgi:hypothetical protein
MLLYRNKVNTLFHSCYLDNRIFSIAASIAWLNTAFSCTFVITTLAVVNGEVRLINKSFAKGFG